MSSDILGAEQQIGRKQLAVSITIHFLALAVGQPVIRWLLPERFHLAVGLTLVGLFVLSLVVVPLVLSKRTAVPPVKRALVSE